MTTSIIITFCLLILLAYLFDLSSHKTKIPTVILLLLLGWSLQQLTIYFKIVIPDLEPILPFLGTIGLVLIVLEGGLDLELNQSKFKNIKLAALSALIPIILLMITFGYMFSIYLNISFLTGMINAIPLCVISSAIAIPSVKNLDANKKEFVIYESSFSDIFGVIIFNFFTVNQIITVWEIGEFSIQLIIILIVSFLASLGLAYLIKKINHHVKFLPIIIIIILIYTLSKIFHLPALIFILIFGLFINNLDELKSWKFVQLLDPDKLDKEVHKFKELVIEFTFLIRTIFFLIFGYTINGMELIKPEGLIVAFSIVALILGVRWLYFKIAGIQANPLVFISPRGLITVLLFLSIPVAHQVPFINESLMIQVILISAIVMMMGLMFDKKAVSTDEK